MFNFFSHLYIKIFDAMTFVFYYLHTSVKFKLIVFSLEKLSQFVKTGNVEWFKELK